MRKLYLYLFLLVGFINLYSASSKEKKEESEKSFATRNICILIDKNDEILPEDPIVQPWFNSYLTNELIMQLAQKAGPILTSKHIYNNYIKMRNMFDDFKLPLSVSQKKAMQKKYPQINDIDKVNDLFAATWKVYQEINNEIGKSLKQKGSASDIADALNKLVEEEITFLPSNSQENEDEKFKKSKKIINLTDIGFPHNFTLNFYRLFSSISNQYLAAYLININLSDWIIKDATPSFALFVPNNYIPGLSHKDTPKTTSSSLTPREISLGLKIDHLENVSTTEISNGFNINYKDMELELTNQLMNPNNNSSKLFVVNKEYNDIKLEENKPRWAIIIRGHGGPTTRRDRKILDLKYTQKLNRDLFNTLSPLLQQLPIAKVNKITVDLNNKQNKLNFDKLYSEIKEIYKKITSAFNDYFSNYQAQLSNIPEFLKKETEVENEVKNLYLKSLDTIFNELTIGHKEKKESIEIFKIFLNKLQKLFELIRKNNLQLELEEKQIKNDINQIQNQDEISGQICGLPTENFISILAFIDTKIYTVLLFYATCYGAGKNLDKVFNKTKVEGNYRTTFINAALTDETILSNEFAIVFPPLLQERDININTKSLNLNMEANYNLFFDELKKSYPIDFAQLISLIHHYKDKNGKLTFFANIPHIKYKNLPWSSVIDLPKEIVKLGKYLGVKKGETISISDFFKRKSKVYPELIMLDAAYIPPITIEKNPSDPDSLPPAFISSSRDLDYHYFEKINAPDFNFFEILNAFFKIFSASGKLFQIKELNVNNITQSSSSIKTYNNILIINNWPDPSSKDLEQRTNTIIYQDMPYSYRYSTTNTTTLPLDAKLEMLENDDYLKSFEDYILAHRKEFPSANQEEVKRIMTKLEKELNFPIRHKKFELFNNIENFYQMFNKLNILAQIRRYY